VKFDPLRHHRRSIRLKGYDYSRPGMYFVTVVSQGRLCYFGEIISGEMILNDAGIMIGSIWLKAPDRFPRMALDVYVVMPNHFHGIVFIRSQENSEDTGGEHKVRPYIPSAPIRASTNDDPISSRSVGTLKTNKEHKCPHGTREGSLGRMMQSFKSITTDEYIVGVKQKDWPAFSGRLWLRNYYEHIIRNEDELAVIRNYILTNPMYWEEDEEHPSKWTCL